jgi:DNA-directed RNA polymerase subunit RPC12/RpoP/predicted RNA-binding protein
LLHSATIISRETLFYAEVAMIGIKCAACGCTFEVPDDQSGKNARCPNCSATVFVPTVGPTEIETPASKAPTEMVEKPRRLLTPLEVVLILVILAMMAAFIVFWAFRPEGTTRTAGNVDAVRQKAERERDAEIECAANMEKIAEALAKYREEHKEFPDDLAALKEAGLFEAGEPLSCKKGKYDYHKASAVASKDIVKDRVLVSDSEPVHRGGRNVVRIHSEEGEALFVDFLKEEQFLEVIAAQQAEYENIVKKQDKKAQEKKAREQEASKLLLAASEAYLAGDAEAARELYKKLVEEYADTELMKENSELVRTRRITIEFNTAVGLAREYVQQLRLDGAREAYAKIAAEASDEQKATIEAEFAAVKLVEDGRALQKLGDLDGALEKFKELGSSTEEPFWKRIARELASEIDTYRREAAGLLKAAEEALKEGKKVKAFSLFRSLVDNYPYAAEAPQARPRVEELAGEVAYSERFLPKDKLIDEKAANALQQQPDGAWKGSSTGKNALDEIALTGLVMLCFLGEGNTHVSGQHRAVLAKAVARLKSAQKDSGLIGDESSPAYRMSHALGLFALSELRNMTGDDELEPVCQKAVNYAIQIQEPGHGWRLADKKAPADISLTAWMQFGMLSAARGELKFLRGLLDGAVNACNAATDEKGRVNYTEPAEQTRPLRHLPEYQDCLTSTAAAVLMKLLSGGDATTTRMKGGFDFINASTPNGTRTNFAYFLFGTYALWQADELAYRQWKWALYSVLLPGQLREGKDAGAWDMGQFSDFRGGKMYPTALAILALQAPYNHFASVNLREAKKEEKPQRPEITLILQDDARITGTLVSETEDKITIEITRGATRVEMTFDKKDIKEITGR